MYTPLTRVRSTGGTRRFNWPPLSTQINYVLLSSFQLSFDALCTPKLGKVGVLLVQNFSLLAALKILTFLSPTLETVALPTVSLGFLSTVRVLNSLTADCDDYWMFTCAIVGVHTDPEKFLKMKKNFDPEKCVNWPLVLKQYGKAASFSSRSSWEINFAN